MRLVTRDSLVPVPWKNGGGVTRQIAIFPPGSDMNGFDWRISTAEVAQDGPFSRFEGIDRRLYILDGAGLELRFGGGTRSTLRPADHLDFAGEAEVHGALLRGPVTDLNIMVRRDRLRACFAQVAVDGAQIIDLPSATAALFVLDGSILLGDGASLTANRHDTVLFGASPPARIDARGTATLLLAGFAARG